MSLIETILVSLRLRKTKKAQDPEKTQPSESAGTTTITPAETRLESFEMKSQSITPPEKPMAIATDIGAEKTGLKLEDELPEEQTIKEKAKKIPAPETEKVKPGKKGRRKKKPANKPEIKAPTEIIPIPETEKPEKKEIIKKKPAKKEAAESTPEKKTAKKEKSEKKAKKKGREKSIT